MLFRSGEHSRCHGEKAFQSGCPSNAGQGEHFSSSTPGPGHTHTLTHTYTLILLINQRGPPLTLRGRERKRERGRGRGKEIDREIKRNRERKIGERKIEVERSERGERSVGFQYHSLTLPLSLPVCCALQILTGVSFSLGD